jgi:beta-lactam-binding protein with PASTA domain
MSAVSSNARRLVLTLAAAMVFAPRALAQGSTGVLQGNYTITDLGVLFGALGDTDSDALAINAGGTVVGYSGIYLNIPDDPEDSGFLNNDAFIWTPTSTNGTTGTMTYLGGLPGNTCSTVETTVDGITTPAEPARRATIASDINSAGQAAGYSWRSTNSSCPTGQNDGVIYLNGEVQDLGAPPGYTGVGADNLTGNGIYSLAASISDLGQVVGWSIAPTAAQAAWLYDGSYHILGTLPGATFAYPNKINNNDTLVGVSGNLGFAHTGTGPILATDALPTLGGPSGTANGINDNGVVVGGADTASAGSHAYYLVVGGFPQDLGTISKDPLANSEAYGINNIANDVVGESDIDIPAGSAWTSPYHAVLWPSEGPPADLNLLLDPSLVVSQDCSTCWELLNANAINDHGQIVGMGLYHGQRHAFLLTPKCINDGGDTDGDGLCDNWEKYGYMAPNGAFVNLPAMGANPMHKDIFVQTDYMVDLTVTCVAGAPSCTFGHTHKPDPAAIAMLTAAFANAPVNNPDGKTGITLHVDCGANCIMNPITGAPWGTQSMANALDHLNVILGPLMDTTCEGQLACPAFWTDFNTYMTNKFLPTGRGPIFHYAMFAHDVGIYLPDGVTLRHITGVSQGLPSNSFVVSLGSKSGQVGTADEQAGTFMHELGHNLGLEHGGLDAVNYKPNYLSVMNYSFQSGLIVNNPSLRINYSPFPAIPDLNPTSLNDNVGLNGGASLDNDTAIYGTQYYCPTGGPYTGNIMTDFTSPYVFGANGAIDWSCTGGISTTNVKADINAEENAKNQPIISTVPLSSSEDWNHLIFDGGGIGAEGVGGSFTPTTSLPNPEDTVPVFPAPFLVQVVSPGFAQVMEGINLNLTYTITNAGLNADTYNLTPVSQYSWWNTSSVPATVTLAGGASQQITIPVTVPSNFGCANVSTIEATFTLEAVSQTRASITDGGVAELDVVSIPGSITVPNVSGLTESEAQAAIVSAGLVVGTVTMQSSSTVPAGTVISQTPLGCGFSGAGNAISIVVSTGPAMAVMPQVVGDTVAQATSAITTAGLTVGTITTTTSLTVTAGNVISETPAAGSSILAGSLVTLLVSSGASASDTVPSVVGQSLGSATTAIGDAGLVVGTLTGSISSTVTAGTVISETPAAGTPAIPGSPVNLVVSVGPSEYTVVPGLVGETQSQALSAISAAGLFLGAITQISSLTVPAGDVIGQSPQAEQFVAAGTYVYLSVSVGPQPNTVPNVYGLPQAAAASAITGVGLTVGTITPSSSTTVLSGDVLSQNPAAGTYATAGSPVSLYVSSGSSQYLVPALSGTGYGGAAIAITAAGLTLGTFTEELSSTVSQGLVISQSPASGTAVAAGTPVNVIYSGGANLVAVPNVVGTLQNLATQTIVSSNFYVAVTRQPSTTVPDSMVISQNPAAGSQALSGSIISLVVSSGGSVVAAIPTVVGMEQGLAENALFAAGFALGSATTQPSTSVPAFHVISQSPAGGTPAPWDTSVSVVFSSGLPSRVTIPNLVGETQAAAISALNAANLTFAMTTQTSATVAAGNVISQNPSPGSTLLGPNQNVSFVVSAGATVVPNYSYLSQFGEDGVGDGQFAQICGLAIDPSSRNIIVGAADGRVQLFDSNGNFKSYFGGSGIDRFGSQTLPYPVFYFGGAVENGLIGAAGALAVDPINHNIVVVDTYGARVLIFNSAGVFQSQFGSAGYGPGQFQLQGSGACSGVAIDPVSENIVVSDTGNNRVQIFNAAGVYQSQFGTMGEGYGQLYLPQGVAIDPTSHNIVVADTGNSRIQIFNSAGGYLSQFGSFGSGNGAFYDPGTVAIDPATHNILVGAEGIAASPQPFLQIFTSAGVYLTQFGGLGAGNGQFGGTFQVPTKSLAFDPVSHNIVVADIGGRVEIFAVASAPGTTTTTLAASINPATLDASVKFSATVTGNGPTGTVQFLDGATSLGAPVALAAGVAALTTSTLAIGTHSITAVYNGDANNAASTSAALSEVVSPDPTTTAVASSLNPAIAGQAVTLTATVSGSSPTGTVEFLNGATSLGAPVALAGGVAALTISTLPVGTDSITAVYSGNASNATSTSPVLQETVSLAPTTTAVFSSNGFATLGQPVTLSGIVTGDNPTGVVQFMDGVTNLGAPVALSESAATLAISTLALGTHSITAVYKGDAVNAASTSPVFSELISQNGPTSTALVASIDPVIVGHSVTFTATVSGKSPSGSIQFMDGATTLGSPVALVAGAAALGTSALPIGTQSITAIYSGDTANAPSTSAVLNEVVSPNATATTVTSSINPATVGQFITFTAAVSGSSPTGPVQFMDGSATLLKAVVLSGGQANLTLAYSSAGTHAITAFYGGDASNSASTSPILSEVVSGVSPMVTAPAPISIPATQAGGATSGAWPALAAFLAGATAVENITPPPVQLPPQINGVAVTSTTLFPLGTTTVTFSFKDSNGNVGSATSTVTVAVGIPRITGSTAGIGTDPSGAIYVNVVLTNTGTGNARDLIIKTLTFRTLSGTGTVTYDTVLSPALPLTIGNLNVGNAVTTKMYLNVPSTATRISITENGPVQDVLGTNYNYSTAEAVIP